MTKTKVTAVLTFVALSIIACGGSVNNESANAKLTATPSSTETPAVIAKITSKHPTQVFTENCAVCHQESGKGGKTLVDGKTVNADDLTSAKMKAKTDEQLYKYIADGIPDEGMPAFRDKLPEIDIKNLVVHIRYLQGERKQ